MTPGNGVPSRFALPSVNGGGGGGSGAGTGDLAPIAAPPRRRPIAISQLPRMRAAIGNQPCQKACPLRPMAATIHRAIRMAIIGIAGSCKVGSVSVVATPSIAPINMAATGRIHGLTRAGRIKGRPAASAETGPVRKRCFVTPGTSAMSERYQSRKLIPSTTPRRNVASATATWRPCARAIATPRPASGTTRSAERPLLRIHHVVKDRSDRVSNTRTQIAAIPRNPSRGPDQRRAPRVARSMPFSGNKEIDSSHRDQPAQRLR